MEAIKKIHIDLKNTEHEEQRIKNIEQANQKVIGDSRGKIDFENSEWESNSGGVSNDGIAWIDNFISGKAGINLDNLNTARFKSNKKEKKVNTEIDTVLEEIKKEVLPQEETQSDIPVDLLKAIAEYGGQEYQSYEEQYQAIMQQQEKTALEEEYIDPEEGVEVLDVLMCEAHEGAKRPMGAAATHTEQHQEDDYIGLTKQREIQSGFIEDDILKDYNFEENISSLTDEETLELLLSRMHKSLIKKVLEKVGMELKEKEVAPMSVTDDKYEYIYNEEGKLMYKRRRRKQC